MERGRVAGPTLTREQLAHVLRAAATIVGEGNQILVLGSQAILGSFDEVRLPERAMMSLEADLALWDDTDESKADNIDGAIGEGSRFHATFGYYGHGVVISTAVLPVGWGDRVVRYQHGDMGSAIAFCLEAHDLVVSKLVAGRQKDYEFSSALLEAGLIDPTTLRSRVTMLDQPGAVLTRVLGWIERAETKLSNS